MVPRLAIKGIVRREAGQFQRGREGETNQPIEDLAAGYTDLRKGGVRKGSQPFRDSAAGYADLGKRKGFSAIRHPVTGYADLTKEKVEKESYLG